MIFNIICFIVGIYIGGALYYWISRKMKKKEALKNEQST